MALIRLALRASYHVRRGPARRLGVEGCPQQSTTVHEPVKEPAEPGYSGLRSRPGICPRNAENERVPCRCQRIVSLRPCPSASRSAPAMWSRAAVVKMGICAYFRAMWCCPAGGGSMFRPIPASRRRTVALPGAHRLKTGPGRPGGGRKNISAGQEPHGNSGIDNRRRAKPPSPSPSITRRRAPVALATGAHLILDRVYRSLAIPLIFGPRAAERGSL
jgi:hypothetical protein